MLKATISKDKTVMNIYVPFIIAAIFTKQKLHKIHGETDTTNNRELEFNQVNEYQVRLEKPERVEKGLSYLHNTLLSKESVTSFQVFMEYSQKLLELHVLCHEENHSKSHRKTQTKSSYYNTIKV